MQRLILFPAFLFACSNAGTKDSDSPDDTQSADTSSEDTDTDTEDTDTDTGTDTAPPDNFSPRILSCDATCEYHDVGDTYWKWSMGCNVNDPDGLENIWNGNTIVNRGGTKAAEYLVACNTQGLCTTGFREDTDNILCSQATSYEFVTRIKDWDGNTSKPNRVNGRQK
jgi:hypothetical protein